MSEAYQKIIVSVIIPCRNEEAYIENTIRSIIANDFGTSRVEILVIDGMSDDNTLQVLTRLSEEIPNIRIIKNIHQSTPYAFNIGINNSRGKYILIVGARHNISKNYIRGCIDSLDNDDSVAGVGGKVSNIFENDKSKGIALAMNSTFGVGGGNFRALSKSGSVDTVGTPMYRKKIFDIVGLFDEALIRNQDDEFNYRVTKAGYKLWLNCDIEISYFVRADFSKLFSQYFQYGYWKVYVNKKLKTITTIRQLVPFLFMLFIILFPITLYFNEIIFLIYPLVIFLYLALLIFTSIFVSKGIGKISVIVFLSFICLHFGYGLGYLNGFFDFILIGRSPGKQMTTLTR